MNAPSTPETTMPTTSTAAPARKNAAMPPKGATPVPKKFPVKMLVIVGLMSVAVAAAGYYAWTMLHKS